MCVLGKILDGTERPKLMTVTENMGSAAASKQFIIGGEGTGGQSITMLVRLALLDQIALMQQYMYN